MTTKNSPKFSNIFTCEICNYSSNKKGDYNKHLLSKKHKNQEILQNTTKNSPKFSKAYTCNCGKIYKHHSSLYNHKKICNFIIDKCEIMDSEIKNKEEKYNNFNNFNNFNNNYECKDEMKELVCTLINENKELRKTITEMIPRIGNNNNNKNKFNINVFLNEKCKDALSIDEFIEKIEVSMNNLLTTQNKGQAEGITDIIVENMNKLSLYERPLHCTDKKRETLYIKYKEWQKDDNREYTEKMIKQIEKKQIQNIKKWMETHPNYENNSEEQHEFTELLRECSKSIDDDREKIIKNLCSEVYVDKD